MDWNLSSSLDSLSVAESFTCDIDNLNSKLNINKYNLKVISQNIRSISFNWSSFITLLTRSQIDWDLIVLTECFLPSTNIIPTLENYNFITSDPLSHLTKNEGVVIYYKKSLKIQTEQIMILEANSTLIRINEDTCLIGIYRPPHHLNATKFINSLELQLKKLSRYKNIIIIGDINLSICPSKFDTRANDYLNMLASNSILPGHSLPTRNNKTCLDHIMIKTKCLPQCCVIDSSITDHDSIVLNINLKTEIPRAPVRTFKFCDYEGLDRTISDFDFSPIYQMTDANDAADFLIKSLQTAINSNEMIKKIPVRKRISKPWITKGLLKCMRNRDNLHKKHKRDPENVILECTYKRYRNFCNIILKKAKRAYDNSLITEAGKSHKKLWNVITQLTQSKNKTDHSPNLLSYHAPKDSINHINSYFASVGSDLARKIIPITTRNTKFKHRDPPPNSFVILPTNVEEIISAIMALKTDAAPGVDNIPSLLLKRYVNILTTPITFLCNLIFQTGVFPRALKIALVKPIYKCGDKNSVDNFRPISLLPSLSKIVERLINNRLVNFLENSKILAPSQFGFRRGKSTEDAVYSLTDTIVRNLDLGIKNIGIFLDFKKAFDTVSVPLLIQKLQAVGVRGLPLSLLTDYLQDRLQQVKIGNLISDQLPVTHGVPQGSILGPTLFLVYINDLCQLQVPNCTIFAFADDTALVVNGKTWDEAYCNAQTAFNMVTGWVSTNMLTLNLSKTKHMFFALNKTQWPKTGFITAHTCNNISPQCSCLKLDRVDTIKYLGVEIDTALTFKTHIQSLTTRLRKLIYIFRYLRTLADRKILKMVYQALCQSLIGYCITSWGGAAKTHLIEVERAQRAILKVGASLPFRHPTFELYQQWEVLTVRQIFVFSTIRKMHTQCRYNPSLFANKRRKTTVCNLEHFNTRFALKFFCFLGAFLYNKANNILIIYPMSRYLCKKALFKWLLSLDYDSTERLIQITS